MSNQNVREQRPGVCSYSMDHETCSRMNDFNASFICSLQKNFGWDKIKFFIPRLNVFVKEKNICSGGIEYC